MRDFEAYLSTMGPAICFEKLRRDSKNSSCVPGVSSLKIHRPKDTTFITLEKGKSLQGKEFFQKRTKIFLSLAKKWNNINKALTNGGDVSYKLSNEGLNRRTKTLTDKKIYQIGYESHDVECELFFDSQMQSASHLLANVLVWAPIRRQMLRISKDIDQVHAKW